MSGTRVVTFGCRLNLAESEAIRAQAELDGVTNAVVFNTCAVTEEAVRQARQAIRKARREEPVPAPRCVVLEVRNAFGRTARTRTFVAPGASTVVVPAHP